MGDVGPLIGKLQSSVKLHALQVRKRRKRFGREVYEATFKLNGTDVVIEEGGTLTINLDWTIDNTPDDSSGG